ncbi:MAG: SPOR domain-containing protein [Bacteroidota bacterium]
MDQFSTKIAELLYEYDCVIIPDLGGFVTNYKSAYVHEDTRIFYPPTKAVGFNSSLVNNDGLLANHIAQAEKISFEEANEQIKKKVEDCFSRLNAGNRVVFEKVGMLFFDEEESIQFEPDESVNFLTESFGMFEFFIPESNAETEKIEEIEAKEQELVQTETPIFHLSERPKEEIITEDTIVVNESSSYAYRYWVAAVILPLFMYLGVVSWQSEVFNGGHIHSSDLNPFKSFEKNHYESRSSSLILEEGDSLDLIVEFTRMPEEPLPDPMASLYANSEIANYPYHVISGCFSLKSNAEKHTKALRNQGNRAFIIDKKGRLWRVSQGSYLEESEAQSLIRQNRIAGNTEVWMLKK